MVRKCRGLSTTQCNNVSPLTAAHLRDAWSEEVTPRREGTKSFQQIPLRRNSYSFYHYKKENIRLQSVAKGTAPRGSLVWWAKYLVITGEIMAPYAGCIPLWQNIHLRIGAYDDSAVCRACVCIRTTRQAPFIIKTPRRWTLHRNLGGSLTLKMNVHLNVRTLN